MMSQAANTDCLHAGWRSFWPMPAPSLIGTSPIRVLAAGALSHGPANCPAWPPSPWVRGESGAMSGRAGVVSGSVCASVLDPELGSGACLASSHQQQDRQMNDWPFRSYLELGALPSALPCARLHAKHVFREWGLEDCTDTIELVVSELVTNAQRASAGLTGSRFGGRWIPGVPPVRLWLCSDKEKVHIRVWDGDHRMPEAQAADLDAESGRGLFLVEAVSREWGVFVPEGSNGKVVWAILGRPGTEETKEAGY